MRIVLASAIVLAAASPALATTFVSGSVAAGTNATLGGLTDPHTNSWITAVAAPLSTASYSYASDGTYSVSSSAAAGASWASADSGFVAIEWGWTIAAAGSTDTAVANTNAVPANWSYTFTASGNGSFSGTYAVGGAGDLFGLQPIYGTNDMPFGPYGGTVYDLTGSGSFAVPLVNGQTYTMAFYNFGNLGSEIGFNAVGNGRADIEWVVSYVPEPASWAMMITGFGLVGVAARRRRSAIA